MSTPNSGGAAFPCAGKDGMGLHYLQKGMTLRDWFAGQALSGLMASPADTSNALEWAPEEAYAIADAMLDARERNEPQ